MGTGQRDVSPLDMVRVKPCFLLNFELDEKRFIQPPVAFILCPTPPASAAPAGPRRVLRAKHNKKKTFCPLSLALPCEISPGFQVFESWGSGILLLFFA
jgi:hypothetical protein